MNQLMKYKKQGIIIISIVMLFVILFGIYLLQTTLNRIHYSKSEAHVIALNQFPGTILTSKIEYEDLNIYYEIKIVNQEQEMIDLVISAESGNIISFEMEQGES